MRDAILVVGSELSACEITSDGAGHTEHRVTDVSGGQSSCDLFIRRGTFRLTTSRGTQIVFGDGTGKPVAVRFATRAAEWGILLDPELRLGEGLCVPKTSSGDDFSFAD